MYACLAVTCHLHFWQNDRDFLRATVVTRRCYRNKSQHRKSTLEKKILPPFQQGFEPATFQSRVRRSNHWAIPAPCPRGVLLNLLCLWSLLKIFWVCSSFSALLQTPFTLQSPGWWANGLDHPSWGQGLPPGQGRVRDIFCSSESTLRCGLTGDGLTFVHTAHIKVVV